MTSMHNVRHALRMLRKSPGFTAVALVTLALGIGANTAIFSVVNGVVLQPLDYAQPERIVRLQTSWAGEPDAGISPAEYFDYRDELDVFSSLGVYAFSSPSITGGDRPERLRGAFVSSGVLPALGARPVLGRTLTAEEELPEHDVAIIGFDLWQRRFSGAEDIVGSRVTLNGSPRTIVGVLPAGFRMPEDYTDGQATEVYLPLGIDRTTIPNRGSHFLAGVARLAPGVSVEDAATAVRALAGRMVEQHPGDYPADMQFAATAFPLAEDVVGPIRPALFVLLCAVGLVLLVACANVANLLIARAEARRGELALRTALGAGRGRILGQLVVESLVLAGLGGVLGVALAAGGIELLVALQPPDVPRIDTVTIDWRVLVFTAATTGFTGVLLGILPALAASRTDPAAALHDGGGRATGGRQPLRAALVIGEIAAALVLVIGATLLVRSYAELSEVDPGYRVDGVLTTDLSLAPSDYADADVSPFFARLLERIGELPGVTAAGAVSNLPLATDLGDLNFEIGGRETPDDAVSPKADWQAVTPDYLDALRIPLISGRGIEPTDGVDAPGVVVLNETAALRYWPGENPLGQRILLGGGAAPGWVTVVGVVRDVRHAGFDEPPQSQMYLSHEQFRFWDNGGPVRGMTLVVRTPGEPTALAGAVRQAVADIDPALPLGEFRTMDQVVSESLARPRLMMSLLAVFAAVALVMGAVGIYGVMAWLVGRRTRELGIRLALGARARDVAGLVLKQSFALTAAGIAAGLAIAAVVTRALGGMLYGVTPLDGWTFVAVPLTLAAVALLAAWIPTWRASRIDPNTVLRHE
ncbi:MAG TPA: ABC transporter permease [Woeseiaceae bacterium]|nr:ABC transporter permease [Woeseiaceae bacterium]